MDEAVPVIAARIADAEVAYEKTLADKQVLEPHTLTPSPSPLNLKPKPCTLHPTPYTLHPNPYP
jgi:hypothetical protein